MVCQCCDGRCWDNFTFLTGDGQVGRGGGGTTVTQTCKRCLMMSSDVRYNTWYLKQTPTSAFSLLKAPTSAVTIYLSMITRHMNMVIGMLVCFTDRWFQRSLVFVKTRIRHQEAPSQIIVKQYPPSVACLLSHVSLGVTRCDSTGVTIHNTQHTAGADTQEVVPPYPRPPPPGG